MCALLTAIECCNTSKCYVWEWMSRSSVCRIVVYPFFHVKYRFVWLKCSYGSRRLNLSLNSFLLLLLGKIPYLELPWHFETRLFLQFQIHQISESTNSGDKLKKSFSQASWPDVSLVSQRRVVWGREGQSSQVCLLGSRAGALWSYSGEGQSQAQLGSARCSKTSNGNAN